MTRRDLLQIAFFVCCARPFLRLFIGLRVRGSQHLPSHDPFILIANHSSHLDTLALLSLLPLLRLRRVRPVAAADYFERNRLVATLTRTFFNILPIARKEITSYNDPLQKMEEQLHAGNSLILFPEGTRSANEEIGPFRSGVARLSERFPQVPVVPAYLVNMGRSLPKGETIPVPFFCEIRLGAPRCFQGDRKKYLELLRQDILRLKGLS